MNVYRHWRDFPAAEWRWGPEFSPEEMACRGTGKLAIHEGSMDALLLLRRRLGRPMIVTSAYRSPEHNRAVGGAARSQHLQARAFDVRVANHEPFTLEAAATACGFRGIGHYPASGFMHIDTRDEPARWHGRGGWFHDRPDTRFEAEASPTPAREIAKGAAESAGVVATAEVVRLQIEAAAPSLPPEIGQWLLMAAAALGAGVLAWRIWSALRSRDA